ncbi:MAG TPA: shikimate kinase [Burkholderiales bacterium]|nr:shikimate kinase [Burkholderiales bacterium]
MMQEGSAGRSGNIYLVGMMGAGKTTVGRQLARRLGKSFFDTDQEIQKRTGVSIPTIFEIEGEAGFRRRESAVLAALASLEDAVLATGGGIVIAPDNRRLLKERGTVVYLRAAVDDLFARTRHDRTRPLLQTEDPRAKLAELFAARDPLYREVADIIIDTSRQSVQTLVRQLEKQLLRA